MNNIIFWFSYLILCPFIIQPSWAKASRKSTSGLTIRRVNETQSKMDGQYYVANCYSVYGGSTIRLFDQNIAIWEDGLKHQKNYVRNIGRVGIHTYVREGNQWQWIRATSSASIYPGQTAELEASQQYQYSQLVITNYKSEKAYVQAFLESGYDRKQSSPTYWNFELDMNNLMKKLVVFGSDYIPVVGPIISNVIDFFWPATSVDAWEEVKDKVTRLIDSSISDLIESILKNKINMFKKRIQTIHKEQKMKIRRRRIGDHYLNIAQDLIGLEEEFVFYKNTSNYEKINYATLPLFSLVVSMKILFYRCGFQNPDALGLDKDDMQELLIYATETLDPEVGIIHKHFNRVKEEHMKHVYDDAIAENLYNDMSNTLNYLAFNGEKYLSVWYDLIENAAEGKPNNPVLMYSSYAGITTGDLQSLGGELPAMRTLTPNLKPNGQRPRIVEVHVHTLNDNAVGIDVIYDDKSVISTGLLSGTEIDKFPIGDDYIVKLDVWGDFPDGIIRGLTFYTDGNSTYTSGTTTETVYTFEMHEQHIAGIHISNDMALEKSEAWNVAVSYQADDFYHT